MSTDAVPPFSLAVVEREGNAVVTAGGEVDVASAPELERCLVGLIDAGTPVVLQLADVTFMDSSGLRGLVTARQRAEKSSVSFTLDSRSPVVDRLLQVTGLDGIFGSV